MIDYKQADPVAVIMEETEGRGVDVAIEALGTQGTFESCLRVLRPGGVLSSLGVYSGKLTLPLDAIAAGLGDHTVVTSLCPGGKERMRRLTSVLASGRADLTPLVTHRFPLDRIEEAYQLFAEQRDGEFDPERFRDQAQEPGVRPSVPAQTAKHWRFQSILSRKANRRQLITL